MSVPEPPPAPPGLASSPPKTPPKRRISEVFIAELAHRANQWGLAGRLGLADASHSSGGPASYPLDPLWATFVDSAQERAFQDHLYQTIHAREAARNVLSAAFVYAGLLVVDWLVLPAEHLRFALVARGAAIAGLVALFALAMSSYLPRIRPALPVAVAWICSLQNLVVGLEVGGNVGIIYQYFVVLLMSLPPLIGRATVREALWCAGGSFMLVQLTELMASDGDPVVWIFLSATCAIGGVYGVYGAWIYHATAHHDFWQARVIEWQMQELAEARGRAERLLLNVLPESIARRLERGERVIADSLDDVTVLFADICGFTAYSAQVTPEALVSRLDAIFRRFDTLAELHGLEKIKTIGDAYMVAAGLPSPQPDHAERVCRFALDMLDAVTLINAAAGGDLQVRVGVHSGPVVAGVIGERKFAYDLWGDTVNTSSRMESHGEPGRVQISAATRAKLGPEFIVTSRGEIQVKGKGALHTFWLAGVRQT